jgi:hypothetical protein
MVLRSWNTWQCYILLLEWYYLSCNGDWFVVGRSFCCSRRGSRWWDNDCRRNCRCSSSRCRTSSWQRHESHDTFFWFQEFILLLLPRHFNAQQQKELNISLKSPRKSPLQIELLSFVPPQPHSTRKSFLNIVLFLRRLLSMQSWEWSILPRQKMSI